MLTGPVKLSLELCMPGSLLQALWRCAALADGSRAHSPEPVEYHAQEL